jgi:hypothetical protein
MVKTIYIIAYKLFVRFESLTFSYHKIPSNQIVMI